MLILSVFYCGWKALSPTLQHGWFTDGIFGTPEWKSWSVVICEYRFRQIEINQPRKLRRFIISQLDDEEPILGFPEMPAGFKGKLSRRNVARIVNDYMECVKNVGLRWLKENEKEGINILEGIFNEKGAIVMELGGSESDSSYEEADSDDYNYNPSSESDSNY